LNNAAEVMFELEKSGVFNREIAFKNIKQAERKIEKV